MNNKCFFYRITLAFFLLSLSAVAGAQGRAIAGGIVRGVVKGSSAAQKAGEQAVREAVLKPGVVQNIVKAPNVARVQVIDSTRDYIPKIVLPPTNTLTPISFNQMVDSTFFGVYLDCLALEDDAAWNDKITILCSRLAVLDQDKSEEQWREYVDSGRSREIRFLLLFSKLSMRSAMSLVGPEEARFGRPEGLLMLRLDEESGR